MSSRVRVAVDLLGGDHAPDVVVDGVVRAADADPDLDPILVGPVEVATTLLGARGRADRFPVVAASQVVDMDEDPARAVRAKRDATVRIAARLVQSGAADAVVSAGSTGATMAAALFTIGRLPGVTRPPLAVVVPATHNPVVLLDVGATVEAGPDLLAQFALAGVAYAHVHLGLERPRIGLLSIGAESGKGDPVRKAAHDALATALEGLPAHFVGNVEGSDVPLGGPADVVVTDGFTGNVLLKGLEGMVTRVATGALAAGGEDAAVRAAIGTATAPFGPDAVGGAVLLGVPGVVVVAHGAASAAAISSSIALAARSVRAGLVSNVAENLDDLVARRRAAMGLPAVAGAGR